MATVVVQHQTLHHTNPPSSSISSASSRGTNPSHTSNKHISTFSVDSPPSSQPGHHTAAGNKGPLPTSLLYPPDEFSQVMSQPPVYSISAETLAAALDYLASQPLPAPNRIFPWLHGLHPENQFQTGFFTHNKHSLRRMPNCWRGITVVKVGGDLTTARLKGAVSLDEILSPSSDEFLMADPRHGFSVRNFQIQTAKLAPLSDIIIYGGHGLRRSKVLHAAARASSAQHAWFMQNFPDRETRHFNTFVLSDTFREIEAKHPELVVVDRLGQFTGQVMDFFQWERFEMRDMSDASEISTNVFQGPTPTSLLHRAPCEPIRDSTFDLLVEANEAASLPCPHQLTELEKLIEDNPQQLAFPSSGTFTTPVENNGDVDSFISAVQWLYYITHLSRAAHAVDTDGDIAMVPLHRKHRRVLIHCPDGYTETSLLVVAYFMFAEGAPVHEALIRLHCEKKRNFFVYPCDAFSSSRLPDPAWFKVSDLSLPSRILPYMYLGNLSHANNPELLRALGIKRVLSIGESVLWSRSVEEEFGISNKMLISGVQDNGIDPLTEEFEQCLHFIRRGKRDGMATLVHCRVGVSRSATICIAEVMESLGLPFPRAYCYVRARRLNVVIQPHLRFVYELMKWEEQLLRKRNLLTKRELEWPTVAREIALMNKPYSGG